MHGLTNVASWAIVSQHQASSEATIWESTSSPEVLHVYTNKKINN